MIAFISISIISRDLLFFKSTNELMISISFLGKKKNIKSFMLQFVVSFTVGNKRPVDGTGFTKYSLNLFPRASPVIRIYAPFSVIYSISDFPVGRNTLFRFRHGIPFLLISLNML